MRAHHVFQCLLALHGCLSPVRALLRSHQPQGTSAERTVADSFNTGRQLCSGSSPAHIDEKAAALMMIGQPFRSKNFKISKKRACESRSMEVQRMLANNHITNLIKPLEQHGFRVDVFLAECTCGRETAGVQADWNPSEEDTVRYSKELEHMYQQKSMPHHRRVVSFVSMNKTRNQFFHVGQMIEHARKRAVGQGLGYRFLMALRYDMKLDFDLAGVSSTAKSRANAAPPVTNDLALNYFMSAEDYFFMFPGGFTDCMNQLFNECLAPCNFMDCDPGKSTPGAKIADEEWQRNPKCYEFGPLVLDAYMPRDGGYVNSFEHMYSALASLSPGYALRAHGGGGFYVKDGAEHCGLACEPKEVNDGFDPSYYKVHFVVEQ